MNPRNEPGRLPECDDETEGDGEGEDAETEEGAATLPALGVSALAPEADGGGADPLANVAPPVLEAPGMGGGDGADGEPDDATAGAVDAPDAEPPATPAAAAPCATPMAMAAAVLAVVVRAVSRVIIVLPTSPRTIRLAINGTRAMDTENRIAVIARRIIWLDPTKLSRTLLALSTALMLPRFTADMST